MWIVKLALNRPYTFLVAALLILILSPIVILGTLGTPGMPVDIFPNINIPVVSILWNYTGFSPRQMEQRIVSPTERSLTTTVNDIEHTESQSLNGIGMIKVFFHPSVKIDMAVAQITAISQTQLRQLPLGTTPPLIIQYSASSVPIIQLSLSSKTLSEQTLTDISLNVVRPPLTNIQGLASPYPYSDEIVPGISATLDMASSPNQKMTGKLVRTSQSIDPNSLTLLAEVDVPNAAGKLLPGGFAQVHFDITTTNPPLVIPGNALIFRAQGTQVGVVDAETDTVHLQDIKIGYDFGTKLEVVDGLKEDDSVILNPSYSLTYGAKAQVETQSQHPVP